MHNLLYARLLPGRLHGNRWTSERETGLKRLRRQIADQVADLSGVSRAQRHRSLGCIATKEGEAKPAFRFSKGSGVGDLERVRDLERADRFAIGRVRGRCVHYPYVFQARWLMGCLMMDTVRSSRDSKEKEMQTIVKTFHFGVYAYEFLTIYL